MGVNISDIDFVMPWVDGSDPAWREEKARCEGGKFSDDREERYRDWDNLKYWFRGVEKFAPWVRKVHFITWGHLPSWLKREHPRLHIVRHEEYMPSECLPTFNSSALEINIHRISGLSEHFVYFNDDMFLIRDVEPKDFFRDGKPCDMLALQPVVANPASPAMSYLYLNNAMVLARHFDKRKNMKKQPGKYWKIGYPLLYFGYNLLETVFPLFTGFYTVHGPSPFCRETFRKVWELEGEVLHETSRHHFRSKEDVSQYLFREWQKLSGEFAAKNITRDFQYFDVDSHNEKLLRVITGQKKKSICINDANIPIDFEGAKREICGAFEQILPEKCSFERE